MLRLANLRYEASERKYWAGDDHRWGNQKTSWLGFWFLAFGGRIRDVFYPNHRQERLEGKPPTPWLRVATDRTYEFCADNFILIVLGAFAAGFFTR